MTKENNKGRYPIDGQMGIFKESEKIQSESNRVITQHPITELLQDIHENPKSFPGIDYRSLVKVLKDISHQSLEGLSVKNHPIFSFGVKPKYMTNVMGVVKSGFKARGDFCLDGVVFELETTSILIDRIQLVIHASLSHPVHVAFRVKYKGVGDAGFGVIPCTTSTVNKMYTYLTK